MKIILYHIIPMPIASYCIFVSCAKVQGLCGERVYTRRWPLLHQPQLLQSPNVADASAAPSTVQGHHPWASSNQRGRNGWAWCHAAWMLHGKSAKRCKDQKVKNENPCLDTFGCGLGDFMEAAVENEPWNTLPLQCTS